MIHFSVRSHNNRVPMERSEHVPTLSRATPTSNFRTRSWHEELLLFLSLPLRKHVNVSCWSFTFLLPKWITRNSVEECLGWWFPSSLIERTVFSWTNFVAPSDLPMLQGRTTKGNRLPWDLKSHLEAFSGVSRAARKRFSGRFRFNETENSWRCDERCLAARVFMFMLALGSKWCTSSDKTISSFRKKNETIPFHKQFAKFVHGLFEFPILSLECGFPIREKVLGLNKGKLSPSQTCIHIEYPLDVAINVIW